MAVPSSHVPKLEKRSVQPALRPGGGVRLGTRYRDSRHRAEKRRVPHNERWPVSHINFGPMPGLRGQLRWRWRGAAENQRGSSLSGHYAFMAGEGIGIWAVDVAQPARPAVVTNYRAAKSANSVLLAERLRRRLDLSCIRRECVRRTGTVEMRPMYTKIS